MLQKNYHHLHIRLLELVPPPPRLLILISQKKMEIEKTSKKEGNKKNI